ncbi:MAG: alpha/beta fold hydrolase [Dichotomicrobium sp.]
MATSSQRPPTARRSWRDIYYTSFDGLRLHARHYGQPNPDTRAVVCLAGLTRNSSDFHMLAEHLATRRRSPREVFALDYRGRGHSDHDPDWRNYSPFIELLDTLDFMATHELHDAAVIGTSRGGIIAMMMAVLRPGMIGAAVLNDIGPEIGTAGLARIMGYAGKIPVPADWNEAVELVRQINERFFTDMSAEDWETLARQSFNETEDGRPAASYDPRIAKALSQIDISKRIPDMWAHYEALSDVPLMILRGENTDLLAASTFEEMKRRHPGATALTIPAQGHPVLFLDRFSIGEVGRFLGENDPVREVHHPIPYELYPAA